MCRFIDKSFSVDGVYQCHCGRFFVSWNTIHTDGGVGYYEGASYCVYIPKNSELRLDGIEGFFAYLRDDGIELGFNPVVKFNNRDYLRLEYDSATLDLTKTIDTIDLLDNFPEAVFWLPDVTLDKMKNKNISASKYVLKEYWRRRLVNEN